MSGGFVKVYGTIRTSSIWVEPHHIFKMWMTLLVEADAKGRVMGSVPGVASLARVTIEEAQEAIDKFLSPDPYSRTKTDEGRRAREIDGGWQLINHQKYREMRTDSQIATAERVADFRARKKAESTFVTSNSGNAPSASASTSGVVVREEVQEEGVDLGNYAVRLAVAANKGLDQPIPRILASSGSTHQVAEILYAADIPIDFAEQVVFDRASACKTPAEVRALSYFTRAVVEAWERAGLKDAAAASALRGRAEPSRVEPIVTCPLCKEPVGFRSWTSHFAGKHPYDDVPNFHPSARASSQ